MALMPYWYNFALMFEALFILTTVDTGTRVGRFLLQELGGYIYKPLAKTGWLPGNIVASFLVVTAWGFLIYSGSISTIWPMFGVANQLLAAIALGVGTAVIVKSGKLRYAWITFIPMLFMFTTTLTASWKLIGMFRDKASCNISGRGPYIQDRCIPGLNNGYTCNHRINRHVIQVVLVSF